MWKVLVSRLSSGQAPQPPGASVYPPAQRDLDPGSTLSNADMVPLLLLPLLWGGSLQDNSGFELRVQKSVTVQEGLCVVVPCSFSYPWSSWYNPAELYVYWFWKEPNTFRNSIVATNDPTKAVSVETQGRFYLLEDPMTNNCSLGIRDARRSDTGNYFFRVDRGYSAKYNYLDETLNLKVTVLTEKPDIHVPESLESGRPTRLTCSLPGYCGGGSLSFSWAGAALDSLKPQSLSNSSVLTLIPRPRDHGTKLTCHVKRQGNRTIAERTIRLNVSYAPALTVRFSQGNCTGSTLSDADMVPLLLLPLLWGGSLQDNSGFKLRVQKSVRVQEGLCVVVPCSFSYSWSLWYNPAELYVYWYWKGPNTHRNSLVATNDRTKAVSVETQGRFYLLEDPMTNNCSLGIRDARKSDAGNYFFRVERGYFVKHNYLDETLNLKVTVLTEKPDIHVPEGLESGLPTRLTCSLPGYCGGRSLSFSWVGAALGSLKPQTLLASSVLTLTPRPRDHGTNLSCQVKRQDRMTRYVGNARNGSSLPVLEGDALRLVCAADSNPPATLSWAQRGETLSPSQPSSPGILELPRVESGHEGEVTCRAQHPGVSLHVSLYLSVQSPLQLLGPSCSWEDAGLHCSCSSRARPAPSLHWRLGEQLLEGNLSNASLTVTSTSAGPWANSSLSLRGQLCSDLRLSCEARNAHGAASAAILLPGKSGSLEGVVPGALGGAGAMALLSLCLCLIFFCILKARRKQAAGRPKGKDDEDPVMGTVSWGSKHKPCPDSPLDQAPPAEESPPPEGQQDIYYANVTFLRRQSQEPQDQEAGSTTEYSEINKSK
ncbi:sialic acid-binding Ig-like lectin 5 [Pteropus vampyrus]|uniref:Sialic acid-binding Ig-like lectin 5 n=1 Tax=Pteropus vampyrus TaxID=132908 RepID=A0A6P6C2R6_PTEVA|nr:sialic acid-binding Ig-like lectin 5 [Pteropus vampyrus]